MPPRDPLARIASLNSVNLMIKILVLCLADFEIAAIEEYFTYVAVFDCIYDFN